jgi:hypothetical protein
MEQPQLDRTVVKRLRGVAKESLTRSYPRYSGFVVVAAIERTDGEVFGGANVEVANYTLRAPNKKRFWDAVVVDGVHGETFGQ